jgi:hypothetical protein
MNMTETQPEPETPDPAEEQQEIEGELYDGGEIPQTGSPPEDNED